MPTLNTKLVDLTGQMFGYLTVLYDTRLPCKGRKNGRRGWVCRCVCGNEITLMHGTLASGNTRSCGCLQRETVILRNKKGRSLESANALDYAVEYEAWCGIKDRCYNINDTSYRNYGGRGITMCTEWRASFWVFLQDMGQRPSHKYSIDRINNEGNYEPSNCRWADRFTQNSNRRDTVYLTYQGRTLCASAWGRELNTSAGTIIGRIKAGWTVDRIVTTPVHRKL